MGTWLISTLGRYLYRWTVLSTHLIYDCCHFRSYLDIHVAPKCNDRLLNRRSLQTASVQYHTNFGCGTLTITFTCASLSAVAQHATSGANETFCWAGGNHAETHGLESSRVANGFLSTVMTWNSQFRQLVRAFLSQHSPYVHPTLLHRK
jgi:hypothetical protein